MKLTGKALIAFKKWYKTQEFRLEYFTKLYSGDGLSFLDISDSMKFGVYQDFFDSKEIMIQISLYNIDSNSWQILIDYGYFDGEYIETHLVSRTEARTEAIKQANKIFNNEI